MASPVCTALRIVSTKFDVASRLDTPPSLLNRLAPELTTVPREQAVRDDDLHITYLVLEGTHYRPTERGRAACRQASQCAYQRPSWASCWDRARSDALQEMAFEIGRRFHLTLWNGNTTWEGLVHAQSSRPTKLDDRQNHLRYPSSAPRSRSCHPRGPGQWWRFQWVLLSWGNVSRFKARQLSAVILRPT